VADIIVIIGGLSIFLGMFLLIIETFKKNILWGVGCLILPLGYFVFMFACWDVSKKPLQIQLAGLIAAIVAGNL